MSLIPKSLIYTSLSTSCVLNVLHDSNSVTLNVSWNKNYHSLNPASELALIPY